MFSGTRLRIATPFALLAFFVLAGTVLAGPAPAGAVAPPIVDTTTSLPLAFELNQGQAQPAIKALVRGRGFGVLVTGPSFVLSLTSSANEGDDVLQFTMVGGNAAAPVSGLDPLPGSVSYYVGNDPAKWRSGIPTYARLKVASVYPGIDLIHYGNQGELEYDFLVAPGAEPSTIRFQISGAQQVRLEPNGDLAVVTKHGTVVHRKPVIYQDLDGTRHAVDGRFVLSAENEVSFAVGDYDREHQLVIDPSIAIFTYFGGTGVDHIKAIAVTSPSGLTFYGGLTTSPTLPVAGNTFLGGPADGFISAMNSNGTSVLLTLFLGGTGSDMLNSLTLDPAAVPTFMIVAGTTDSANFPSMNAAQPTLGGDFDAFVTKFNISIAGGTPTATLAYSTYLGGSDADFATGIAVSNSANGFATFVAGSTLSTDFPHPNALQPTHGGAFDSFLAKFNADGTLAYSTFLGGPASEYANGVAVFNQTAPVEVRPFVTGTARLPAGRAIAFVFAVNAAGNGVTYAKTFGAQTAETTSKGIAVDNSGAAYITGGTNDAALPLVAPVQAGYGGNVDAYVAKFDPAGNTVFATYMGGGGLDRAFGIAVDTFIGGNNNIIIAGLTSGSFPATAIQTTFGGGPADAFVVLLRGGASYSVAYATYLGGPGVDVAYAVCVGSAHNARVGGITESAGLSTAGVAQPNIAGGYDGFVTRITTSP